ncbi:alkaline phosphatase D [Dolichospermum phage Dfl-JY23]
MGTISTTVKVSGTITSARLAASLSASMTSPIYSANSTPDSNNLIKCTISGLADNTLYYLQMETNGTLKGAIGKAKTPPTTASNFKFCLASCARTNSNHPIFDAIYGFNPDFFLHLGDIHYYNINVNNVANFHTAYDSVFAQAKQAKLYSEIPMFYIWDDHDYGADDSDSSSVARPAAIQAYKERVPYSDIIIDKSTATSPVYYKFDYGRCVFLVTDARSQKTTKASTDNSSKTVLGAAQKAWLIDQFNNNANKFIFWVCSFPWIGGAVAGADYWAGYTTERTEIANAIKAAGIANRMMILSGDMHGAAYDSGANSDYATGGGAAIKVLQAAPLDQTVSVKGGGWSSGSFTGFENQFGMVEIVDTGSTTIDVNVSLHRYNSTTGTLTTQLFSANNTITISAAPPEPWEQIYDLAVADGWAFLYDPGNPNTRATRVVGADTFITSISSSINSGTYPTFSQATTTKQPLLVTGLLGDLTFCDYDITQRQQLDAATFPAITNLSVMTIARSLSPAPSGTQPYFVAGTGTASPGTRAYYFAHNNLNGGSASMATNSTSGVINGAVTNTNYPIVMGVHNALNNKLYINNVQSGSTITATAPVGVTKASIGSRGETSEASATSGNFDGYLGLIIGYIGEPPTDVRTRMYDLINSLKA